MKKLVRVLFGVGAIYLYAIAFAVAWLMWSASKQEHLVTGDSLLKQFIEQNGLNLLGDSLSGILAPVTLVVIVATLIVQQMQMDATVKEMKQQNELSGKIANANYKLALFEKRLKAYNHFMEARTRFTTDESKDPAIIQALSNALKEAEFVYDKSVRETLTRIIDGATTLGLISMRIEREHKRRDKSPRQWSTTDDERLVEDYHEFASQSNETRELLDDPKLLKAFAQHLSLPDCIVDEEELKT